MSNSAYPGSEGAAGLGGSRDSDSGFGADLSSTGTSIGSASGAAVGRSSMSPDAPSNSPGSDPGSELGDDELYDPEGAKAPLRVEGVAELAAEENTQDSDPDNPARVAGATPEGTSPGYSP